MSEDLTPEDLNDLVKNVKIRALPHFYEASWKNIEKVLGKKIKNCKKLEAAMRLGPDGRQGTELGIDGLKNTVKNAFDDEERAHFFGGILPFIQKLVLDMPELFPDKLSPTFCRPHTTGSIDLIRHQAASLLARCFFVTFRGGSWRFTRTELCSSLLF
eukprot:TRINITY_DN16728_c0_g1_i1.p1 TRINITY_DN16728_c0_g1~~TRINITY_DN16728_c0_g1_i1.p1  ORF type:complete len:158 (-),score=24.36 TRINITY_DN16728_c0_g1_i1:458-931(-)